MTKSVFSEKYHNLLEILVNARKDAGLTQKELSIKLRKPQSYVSKYECGDRRIDVIEFIEICTAIGINSSRIFNKLSK